VAANEAEPYCQWRRGGKDFDMDGDYGRRRRGLGSQRGEANKKKETSFFFL
jgi:hypothetical protein